MSDEVQDDVESDTPVGERFRGIVQKAREARNTRERLLNESHDRSTSVLGVKRHKKRHGLSESFVMRQASALSRKNKQLVNALLISKQQIHQFENALRSLQSTQMALRIKLNSREVDLKNLSEQCKNTEVEKDRLLTLIHAAQDLFAGANICSHDNNTEVIEEFAFSAQPRKVKSNSVSSLQGAKPDKWNPDLTMIQEKSFAEKTVIWGDKEERTLPSSPGSSAVRENFCDEEENEVCDEITVSPEFNIRHKRKSRRQSTLFTSREFEMETDANSALKEQTTVDEISTKEIQQNFAFESNLSQKSMDLTNPGETVIEVGSKQCDDLNVRGSKQSKQTKPRAKAKKAVKSSVKEISENKVNPKTKQKAKKCKRVSQDLDDFFNCSDDSFVTNPEKRIVLGDKISNVIGGNKQRSSLQLSDVNNRCFSKPSRRSAPVCYKEPSLNSKLRRGDKISDGTLYSGKSPKSNS